MLRYAGTSPLGSTRTLPDHPTRPSSVRPPGAELGRVRAVCYSRGMDAGRSLRSRRPA